MSQYTQDELKYIIEGAIMAGGKPLSLEQIGKLFEAEQSPSPKELQDAIQVLKTDYESRGINLVEVASGFRFQVKESLGPWLQKLWEEKPPKYSRAILETLALIIYKQPITRSEIEDIRGVAVSTNIIKTLIEREWIRIVGHKELPGKPALYGTTKQFLDDFNIKNLSQLPPLEQLSDLESIEQAFSAQLQLHVTENDANPFENRDPTELEQQDD